MSCHRTPEIIADHLDEKLGAAQRSELQSHLADCADCRAELETMQSLQSRLSQWREQAVPAWNRRAAMAHRRPEADAGWSRGWWQWAPLAASMVLALAVVFNVQIEYGEQGTRIAFGDSAAGSQQLEARWQEQMRHQYERQQEELETMLDSFGEQQAAENRRMVNAALTDFADETAQSLEQVVHWVEQQRQQDMEMLEASFEQMMEREYRTIQSMQQLASHVQYQGALGGRQ